MLTKGVTLRGIEVFCALADSGSVAQAAAATGLSQPAVSQQIRNLETALGTALVDHTRRPMRLTSAGRSFLVRSQSILSQLRLAQNELTTMDLSHLSTLNMGVIDDFDNDLTPRLVTLLAESLSRCRFRLITAPSHEITAAMQSGDLHVSIAATGGNPLEAIAEYPLLEDPFIFVAPRGMVDQAGSPQALMTQLPFLRYDRHQFIGRQIDAHLSARGLQFSERFEIGAHLSLMTLAARGVGWAITTPLGYMRAERFHPDLEVFPLPFDPFHRTISLFSGADWIDRVPRDIAQTMRGLLRTQVLVRALREMPWLDGQLRVLDEA